MNKLKKNNYFIKQILYDLKTGFSQNGWLLLVYFIGTIVLSQVQLRELIDMGLCISNGSGLVAMLKGIKEISEMNYDLNSFRIPVEWIWLHVGYLIGVAGFPMHDYDERGYQFLIRSRNKKIWWFSKCAWVFIYSISCCIIFYLSMGVSNLVCINNLGTIDETYFGSLSTYVPSAQLFYIMFIMPILSIIAFSMVELMVIFMKNEIIGIVIVLIYIIASAYKKNPLLVGNYLMICRYDFSRLGTEIILGTIICLIIIVGSVIVGYMNFKKIEWGNHKCI